MLRKSKHKSCTSLAKVLLIHNELSHTLHSCMYECMFVYILCLIYSLLLKDRVPDGRVLEDDDAKQKNIILNDDAKQKKNFFK